MISITFSEFKFTKLRLLFFFMLYSSLPIQAQNKEEITDTMEIESVNTVRNNKLSNWQVMLDVGFSHWTSDRFRTGILGTDLGFGLRFNPGLSWLQLHGRYDYSTIRTVEGDTIFQAYNDKQIGFTSMGLGLCKEFRHKNQGIMVGASASVLFVNIESRNMTVGYSNEWNIDYLFYLPNSKGVSLGVSLHLLSRVYNITDMKPDSKEWFTADKEIVDRDLNYTLGLIFKYDFPSKMR